ncbi:hypothetical protein FQN54_006349 [Arachnomyces sp. PD_36]|nr:hypothetical protein FQN54_006349 [Arachnomyces sp. PD_36]
MDKPIIADLGSRLIVLVAITQPLEQLLVRSESLRVMTCDDNIACDSLTEPRPIGVEPWPNSVAHAPLFPVMQKVSNEITTSTGTEVNPYLWGENVVEETYDGWTSTNPSTLKESPWFFQNDEPFQSQPFWTSSFVNGTTTGVLRQHAMRLNSSVRCETTPRNRFPTPCPGDRPFVSGWDFAYRNDGGNDIREELYVKYTMVTEEDGVDDQSFALHCTAITTRGYFELGNHFNGQESQPLLTTWPTEEQMHENFVDYAPQPGGNYSTLAVSDTHTEPLNFPVEGFIPDEYLKPVESGYEYSNFEPLNAPGPLHVTAIAAFGNQSFIGIMRNNPNRQAAEIICSRLEFPFVNFDSFSAIDFCDFIGESQDNGLESTLTDWIGEWKAVEMVEKYLSFSMFYANHATLAMASNYNIDLQFEGNDMRAPRAIYSSDGYTTQKPEASFGSIIV